MGSPAAELSDGGAAALKSRVRRARRASHARQVFLELFSGSGGVSRALAQNGPHAAIDVDIRQGVDLTHPSVKGLIRGWMRSRVVRGLWLGFPCTTWSNARRPALRSRKELWGRPGLAAPQQLQVALGNATLRAALSLMREGIAAGIPVVAENPESSLAWQVPFFARAAKNNAVQQVTMDFCAFGAAWRKSTRLWSAHCDLQTLAKRCGGAPGWCHTGKRHIRLSGRGPDGRLRTKIAEPYPQMFARQAAAALVAAADRIELSHVFTLGHG